MVIFKDDDQDTLIKGLYSLKEALNEAKDLSYLEPGVFLAPFLEIIRSEETTGPVTSLALSAVNKIISYGLISIYPLFYSLKIFSETCIRILLSSQILIILQ